MSPPTEIANLTGAQQKLVWHFVADAPHDTTASLEAAADAVGAVRRWDAPAAFFAGTMPSGGRIEAHNENLTHRRERAQALNNTSKGILGEVLATAHAKAAADGRGAPQKSSCRFPSRRSEEVVSEAALGISESLGQEFEDSWGMLPLCMQRARGPGPRLRLLLVDEEVTQGMAERIERRSPPNAFASVAELRKYASEPDEHLEIPALEPLPDPERDRATRHPCWRRRGGTFYELLTEEQRGSFVITFVERTAASFSVAPRRRRSP